MMGPERSDEYEDWRRPPNMPETADEADERRRQDEAALLEAYRTTFAGTDGQMVFEDLMREGGFEQMSVPFDTLDTNNTMINEGKRHMALYIRGKRKDAEGRPKPTPQREAIHD